MNGKSWWGILLLGVVAGCTGPGQVQEGSEEAARRHLAAEMDKWMADQESEAKTMKGAVLAPPVGYEFRSVVPDEPDFMARGERTDLQTNYKSWPAYKFNVYIEWRSKAETPLEKVTVYTLTWNPHEKKWYVRERF